MILHKVLKYLSLALCVIAAIFFIYTLVVGDQAVEMDENGVQATTVVPMMYIGYIVMAMILALVIIFVVINLINNPAAAKRALVSVGLLVAVIAVAYFVFADNSVLDPATDRQIMLDDGEPLAASTSKWIGGALWTFYIVGFFSIVAIIWAGASKLIKK
jgi:TRAP-type C4-dicarboxylate transport system permease small subunit